MIDGVVTKQLKVIADERGYLMEMLREDDPFFEHFGQSYATVCYPDVIKAWHYHRQQVDHFVCVWGMAKVVLYDDRDGSPTKGELNEFYLGEKNPMMLKIPILVYHGFTTVGGQAAMIVNHPTKPYNPKEPDEFRLPYNTEKIPYTWEVKHG